MRCLDDGQNRATAEMQTVAHLAIQTARSMFQRHVTKHQLDSVRFRRKRQRSGGVAGVTILIYIAADEIASSYEYALPGPLERSITPKAVLDSLELNLINFIRGGDRVLEDSSDEGVVIPESAKY